MDILNMLENIKGKVLDASHIDMLKQAYEQQNQNIVQLKENNDALREQNKLLEQKINELNDENTNLKETLKNYENKTGSPPRVSLSDNFSDIAVHILELYIINNTTEMWEKFIMRKLPFSNKQVQKGLNELCREEMISSYSFDPSHGKEYSLTEKGRYYLANEPK